MAIGKASLNVTAQLRKKDEEYQGSNAVAGQTALTFPSMIHGMRVNMNTSHQKQAVNLLNPDPPLVSTGAEKLVGKYSTGYKETKNNLKVINKIVKYEDRLDDPIIYELFVYNGETGEYDVIHRIPLERLTEKFGYQYDNEVIDGYDIGDIIPKNTILYRSRSYDKDMNYGYGKNVLTMYSLDPYTTEDAAVCSRSLSESMVSIEADAVEMSLNDNDFLLNLYGDDENYIPLPEIGQEVSVGPIVAWRRLINDQLLYDFKASGLRKIRSGDVTKSVDGDYVVIDYEIYNNSDELEDTDFTRQLNDLYRSQTKYYKAIYKQCKKIMESGSKYTHNIDYLYKRAEEMLDTSKKWRDNDTVFSNMEIRIIVMSKVKLKEGSKITGRCGNKSVMSIVREDDQMPVTEDGRRIDLILNLNAVINRTTAFAQFELLMNSIQYQVREKMKTMSKLKDKEILFFDALKALSEGSYLAIKEMYNDFSTAEKKEFMQSVIDEGIYMEQPPLWQETPLFDRLNEFMLRHNFIKSDHIYTMRYGRRVKSLMPTYIGEMYIMKLKQSDKRGYCSRSTGAVDIKGLGTRSHNSHSHDNMSNDKPVRFGEQETLNFLIGMCPIELVLIHALLRTSTDAKHGTTIRGLEDPIKGSSYFKIPEKYKSLVGEIAHVYLRALGIKIEIRDANTKVVALDNTEYRVHSVGGKEYLATDRQAYMIRLVLDAMKEELVMTRQGVVTKEEMRERIVKRLQSDKTRYGLSDISIIDEFNVV